LPEQRGGDKQGNQSGLAPVCHQIPGKPFGEVIEVGLVQSLNALYGMGHPRCKYDNRSLPDHIFPM